MTSKQILLEHKLNILAVVDSVKIYPKDYRSESALSNNNWHVRYGFRRKSDNKRIRKALKEYEHNEQIIQINGLKDHKTRVEAIEKLKELTIHLLETNPVVITKMLYGLKEAQNRYPSLYGLKTKLANITTISEAFEEAYLVKASENVGKNYLKDVRSIKNRFIKYLGNDVYKNIILLSKKMCYEFITEISKDRANRTFNNNRTNLQSLLEVLVNKEYIDKNYMDLIKPKSKKPEKNTAFSREQIKKLFELMEDNPKLRFYCLHIYMGLMRCLTVNRLRVKDIDMDRNIFDADTKTGNFHKYITEDIKTIYETLDLSEGDKYVFGRNKLIESVVADPETMQGYYGGFFKPYKEKLGIPKDKIKDYTLTSFRHSGIGNFWKNKAEELKNEGVTDYKNKACEFIMQFTKHKSINEVWAYLREVDPLLMEDYGQYIKI